jgi:hypothetical protein
MHRLPDGTWTDNIQQYGKAWKALGEKVEKFFPSYTVMGYDPYIRMVPRDRNKPDGYFDLPAKAALELVNNV